MEGSPQAELVDIDRLRKEVQSEQGDTYDWTYENGRRYASTQLGHYYMPNDEPEIQRLNEQHWISTQVKGGALHKAPFAEPDEARGARALRVLDIGCGSGIWCIQMAEDYPDASITGMDVSPIQPSKKPANVEWVLHDMEKEWPFPEKHFDLIHLSLVHGCVTDWNVMMGQIERHLVVGGYVEHQEFSLCRIYDVDMTGHPVSHPTSIDSLAPLIRWSRLMEQAANNRGRTIQLGPHLVSFQRVAGLDGVSETIYRLHVGVWPENPTERMIGKRMMLNALSGMDGFTTVLFTTALGWSQADTAAFLAEVKNDIRRPKARRAMDLHVVYSQKLR